MLLPFDSAINVTRPLLPQKEKINNQINEIWESKWLTNNGPKHEQLTSELMAYLSTDYLSLFNNGTTALMIALKALDLSGEVITTPFTFPATLQALDWNGLTPVFCDIDPVTLNMDVNKIESLITERTSAILAVHVFGNPCDVQSIQQIADKYNLKVIYDGAHVFGTKVNGQSIANFGDATMFSFHATKLFNTVEGGAVAFKDKKTYERAQLLKNFGLAGPEEVVLSGFNAKMNEIQAAMGLEVLPIVETERNKREKLRQTYEDCLQSIPGIRIVTKLTGEESSYQYFVIVIDEGQFGQSRDWLYEKLKKYNVFARRYFSPLCSEFPWYKNIESAKPENLPVAHQTVKEVLSMPYYGDLPVEDVKRICCIIKSLHSDAIHENNSMNVGVVL